MNLLADCCLVTETFLGMEACVTSFCEVIVTSYTCPDINPVKSAVVCFPLLMACPLLGDKLTE